MRERASVLLEKLSASVMLNDPNKELDSNQIAYLSGVCQALSWVLGLDETEPPTKGF